MPTDPLCRDDGGTEDGGLRHLRNGYRHTQHVSFDLIPNVGSGGAARDANLVDSQPGRHNRGGDVTQRKGGCLEDGTNQVRPLMREGEADEGPAGEWVPDGRALAR